MTSVTRAWYGGSWVWREPDPEPPREDPRKKKRPLRSLQSETSQLEREELSHGLVMGRFLPVHRGHQFLLEHATRCTKRLTVLIAELGTDPIPGAMRETWIRELCPNARILRVGDPALTSFAWDEKDRPRWIELVEAALGEDRPQVLFSSEQDIQTIARWLRLEPRSLDPGRTVVPVSGTAIREHPLENWAFLTDATRGYYAKRVCLIGPEGSGKSTLAAKLASIFGTRWAPEQTQFLTPGTELQPAHLGPWLTGQTAAEDVLARQAEKVLFCDGGAPMVQLWSQELFGAVPEWVRNEVARRHYDLYLVMEPQEDEKQPRPLAERKDHFEAIRKWVEGKARWKHLEGSWELRECVALEAIRELLEGRG